MSPGHALFENKKKSYNKDTFMTQLNGTNSILNSKK